MDRVVLNPGYLYDIELMEPYFGNPRVVSVLLEGAISKFQGDNENTCLDNLWSQEQGTFGPGPFCEFVPEWDEVEPLKDKIDDGSILPEQSAVLLYQATPPGDNVSAAFVNGVLSNVGWMYVTDDSWSGMASQMVYDEQATAVLAFWEKTC